MIWDKVKLRIIKITIIIIIYYTNSGLSPKIEDYSFKYFEFHIGLCRHQLAFR